MSGGKASYAKGARVERRALSALLDAGWWGCRIAGSHTEADVVACRRGVTLLVQAKADGRLDPIEWNALYTAAELSGAVPILVEAPARQGLRWWRLTGRKDRPGERAPKIPADEFLETS